MTKNRLEVKIDKILNALAALEMTGALSAEDVAGVARAREAGKDGPRLDLSGVEPTVDGARRYLAFERGTQLTLDFEGNYTGGAALCSDGAVRKFTWLGKITPDAPVSAAVKVGERTVSGYLLLEPAHAPQDPPALKFLINPGKKHGDALPVGTFRGRRQQDRTAETPQATA